MRTEEVKPGEKRPTRLESFIRKYGPIEGPARLRYIGKVAAHAGWKARYRDR